MIRTWLARLEDRLTFVGSSVSERVLGDTPADYGLTFGRVTIRSADGVALMAWEIPAASAAPWVLYLHGNGRNVSSYLEPAAQLHRLGFNVLLLEYRGFGESEGFPSEAGLYRDADAAYRHLMAQGVPAARLVVYGFSLGTGVAIDVSSRLPVGALVVEAGYTSLPDVARSLYRLAPTSLMRNRFASAEKLARVRAPTLFMHARDDRTVPFAQGQRLFALSRQEKAFLELQQGHLGLIRGHGGEVWAQVGAFLWQHLPTKTEATKTELDKTEVNKTAPELVEAAC